LSAGIAVKMITGDHAVTAASIGKQLGIEGRAVTGADIERMTDDELRDQIDEIGVFARVAPEHKMRLVGLLQSKQRVVAMTGDGVNDAPALKKSDMGVAMGITGTEVSKEAATMVLTDDNFATIVGASSSGPGDLPQHRVVRSVPAVDGHRLFRIVPDCVDLWHRRRQAFCRNLQSCGSTSSWTAHRQWPWHSTSPWQT